MPPLGNTEDQTLTVDALVDLQAPGDISISTSGQVAYSLTDRTKRLDKELTSSIWVAEVTKQHSSRQITSGLFNDKSPKWSPDGKLIAFISDRVKAGDSSAIYLISVNGGEAYPITKADNKKPISSFSWSPNGKFIAFTSADEKSEEREAKDKKKDDAKVYGEEWEYNRLRCVHVATREISDLFALDSHVDKFSWNQCSTEIVFTLHRTPDLNSPSYHGVEFRAVSPSDKKSTLLSIFPGPVDDLVEHEGAIYFIAGTTPKTSCTSSMLYQLLVSQEKENRVLKVAYGVDSCALDLRRSGPYVAVRVQKGLSDEIHRLRQTISMGPEMLSDAILHDEKYELSTWDLLEIEEGDDKTTYKSILCFGKSEGDAPTEIFSKVEDEVLQLSNHGSTIARLHLMEVIPIYCEAKDGTKIDAVFHTPSRSEKKKLPTVVMPHGGPYWRSSTSFDSSTWHWAPWLVSAGYAVLCPNYRGSSGYGNEVAKASEAGMGTKDYDDVISLLKKGISDGYIDEERVAIAGHSQGGFLSYLAVTRQDFTFKAAVCASGVSDWDTMSFTSDAPAFESDLAGGAPWESDYTSTAARHGSAVWHMKDVTTPVLILHGEEDKRCPLSNAVAFHRGCLHHGIACEFVVYPREGHNISERQHRVDVLNRLRRFIDLHLG